MKTVLSGGHWKTSPWKEEGEWATPTFLASHGFSKCLSPSKFSSIAGTRKRKTGHERVGEEASKAGEEAEVGGGRPTPWPCTYSGEHIPLESISPSRKPAKDVVGLAAVPTCLPASDNSSTATPHPGTWPFTSTTSRQDTGRCRAWVRVLRARVHHARVKGRVRACPVRGHR